MKKITLSIIASLCATFAFAQGMCSTATAVNLTTNTSVASYGSGIPTLLCGSANTSPIPATGGAWYTYNATANGALNVTSNLAANANNDTRLNIYSGTCGNLVCVGGNDDVDYTGGVFSSDVTVSVVAGTTYYIAWDNRWSADAFVFATTFTAVSSAPNAVTTPSPVDGATGVAVDTADNNMDGTPDNAVALSWVLDPAGAPATEYDIFYGDSPTTLNNLTANATFTSTSVRITGNTFNDLNYWQIVAINSAGSTPGPIWSFTTEATASIDDLEASKLFSVHPNPADSFLNIVSEESVSDVNVSNLLGQRVISNATLNNNRVDVSSLTSGIYIISAVIGDNATSLRFVKK